MKRLCLNRDNKKLNGHEASFVSAFLCRVVDELERQAHIVPDSFAVR